MPMPLARNGHGTGRLDLLDGPAGGGDRGRRVPRGLRRTVHAPDPRLPRGALAGLSAPPGAGRRGPGRLHRVPEAGRGAPEGRSRPAGRLPRLPLRARPQRRPEGRTGPGSRTERPHPTSTEVRRRRGRGGVTLSRLRPRLGEGGHEGSRGPAGREGRAGRRRPLAGGSSCSAFGSRTACRSARSPASGRRTPRRCTANTPARGTSSRRPCSRSWRSTTPALPPRPSANAPSCSACWSERPGPRRYSARSRRAKMGGSPNQGWRRPFLETETGTNHARDDGWRAVGGTGG